MTNKSKFSSLFFHLIFLVSSQFVYAQDSDFNKVVPFLKGNKWGLVYPNGQEFYPPVFDSIKLQNVASMYSVFTQEESKENQKALVRKGGVWLFLTSQKKLFPLDKITRNQLFPVNTKPKKVEPKRELAEVGINDSKISEEMLLQILSKKRIRTLITAKNGNTFEIIDSLSKVSIYKNGIHISELDADKFYASRDFDDKYRWIILEKDGNQGLVDANTLLITIPFSYEYINDYFQEEDWKIVKKNNSWGIVDSKHNEVIPIKYQLINGNNYSEQKDSLPIITKSEDKFSFVRYENSALITSSIKYDFLNFFKYNFNAKPQIPLYIAINSGKKGLVNYNDDIIIPISYDSIFFSRSPDLLLLTNAKKMGFYNLLTGFLKEPIYDEVVGVYRIGNINKGSDFYILNVRKNKKTFFIDTNGTEFLHR